MAVIFSINNGKKPVWIFNVSYAVGPNCMNKRDDVQLVQTLLNGLLPYMDMREPQPRGPRATTYLALDGYFGPKTEARIRSYQFLYGDPDGRIDVSTHTGTHAASKDGLVAYFIWCLNKDYLNSYGRMPDEERFVEPLRTAVKTNKEKR